jgi:uncharacterized membrane protein
MLDILIFGSLSRKRNNNHHILSIMQKKNGITLIALGSLIVLIGVGFYILDIAGAVGMLVLGFAVELYGVFLFWKSKKS